MKSDTSKFTNVSILYDDGNFAFAKGLWDNHEEGIGARWHNEESEGVDTIGYPQTYGKAQWFIFPTKIGKVIEMVLSRSCPLLSLK
jgi:hypothetical protein